MLRLKHTEGRTYNSALQPDKVLLKPPVTRFGRSSEHADVVLDSSISPRMISRIHAEIHFDDGKFRLDCKGMNGVLINQTKRDSFVLRDGDEVVFGGAGVKTKDGQHVTLPESELVYVFSETAEEVPEEERSLGEGTSDGRVRRSKRKLPIRDRNTSSLPGKRSKVIDEKTNEKSNEALYNATDRFEEEVVSSEELEERKPKKGNSKVNIEIPEKEDSSKDSKSKKWLEDLNEELLCCICRELMVLAHTLPCSHAFCYSCIRDWLGQSSDCPNCRAGVRLKSAVPVKALDNTIDKVAEEVLSPEELEERKQKIQQVLIEKREAKESISISSSSDSSSTSNDSSDSEEESETEYSYGVEHARSGRAQCRSCYTLIPNRSLRWALHFRSVEYYEQTHYYHLNCLSPPSNITIDMGYCVSPPSNITFCMVTIAPGLTRAERRQVQALLR